MSRLPERERKASRMQEEKEVKEPQKSTERPMNNGAVALVALWDFEAAVITFIMTAPITCCPLSQMSHAQGQRWIGPPLSQSSQPLLVATHLTK